MNGDSSWLIEFPGSGPAWWDGRGSDTGVLDANDAVRFARQEDAQRVCAWIIAKGTAALVTEHCWSPAEPEAQPTTAEWRALLVEHLSVSRLFSRPWAVKLVKMTDGTRPDDSWWRQALDTLKRDHAAVLRAKKTEPR